MKSYNEILLDIAGKVELTPETVITVQSAIDNTKSYPNVRWFKHKVDLPYMKTVNTFILTMHIDSPSPEEMKLLTTLDVDDPEHQRLHAIYGRWAAANSMSIAYLIRDWDCFDVPVLDDLNYHPCFNESSALDWLAKEWYVNAELEAINGVELPKL